MKIAHNPSTGEYLGLNGDRWEKLTVAKNKAGDVLYLSPEGWTPMPSSGRSKAQEPEDYKEASSLGQRAGMGVRDVLEGLGSVPHMVAGQPMNAVNSMLGGDPNYFKNPGTALSNALGLPTAETDEERLVSAASQSVAGGIPMMGTGMAMQAAGKAPAVAKALTSSPVLQNVSDATAGLAGEAARQNDAGTGAQLAAALFGGFLPSAALFSAKTLGSTARGLGGAWNSFTPKGRDKIAAETLAGMSSDRATLKKRLENAVLEPELVPGSTPTTAEALGDRGLSRLEKGLAQKEPRFGERRDLQHQARQEALLPVRDEALAGLDDARFGLEQKAKELQSPESVGRGVEDFGRDLGKKYQNKYEGFRGIVSDVYNSIDPDGKTSFDLRPLVEMMDEALDIGRYNKAPQGVESVLTLMRDDISNGVNASFKDLQGLRSSLSDMEYSAASTGDKVTARYAGRMKGAVDDYLTKVSQDAELQGKRTLPAYGSRAYEDATKNARSMTREDPHFDNLAYMAREGINREAIERAIGADGVRELNHAMPGLIRKNGKLKYDEVASELGYTPDYMPSSGQDLVEALQARLSGGGGRFNKTAGKMRDALLQDGAGEHRGFSPLQADVFNYAKKLRRMQGEMYEQGLNEKMSRSGKVSGEGGVRDADIPSLYWRSGKDGVNGVRDFIKWADGDKKAIQILKDYAVESLRNYATKDGVLNTKKWRNWMDNHSGALSQLPDLRRQLSSFNSTQRKIDFTEKTVNETFKLKASAEGQRIDLDRFDLNLEKLRNAGFSEKHINTMQRVQKDLRRSAQRDRYQAARGSDTFQNLSTAQAIQRAAIGGSTGSTFENAMAKKISNFIGGLAAKYGLMDEAPEEAIRAILSDAMLDPSVANALMRRASAERVNSLLSVLEKSAGKVFGGMPESPFAAYGNTAVRETGRERREEKTRVKK